MPRRVCVAVVVDAGQLDDVLKRLALDSLASTCGSRRADSSPSRERQLEVPLIAWFRRWHVLAIVGMAALGVALGLAAARQSNASADVQGPRRHETAERLPEIARASSDAGVSGSGPSTQPAPTRAPLQSARKRGAKATIPGASDVFAPGATTSAPRAEVRTRADAGLEDSEYIREL